MITLVLTLEMYLINRKKEKFYLYFHGYWLTSLQFQTAYLFACALVNLFISRLWITGSMGHPMGDKVLKDTADIKYPILVQREFHTMQ